MTTRYEKIVIHDFSGHPFQLDLSEDLCKEAKEVHHIYFDIDKGPKGDFKSDDHPSNLIIHGIGTFINYSKTNLLLRFVCEFIYGFSIFLKLLKINPQIVISGNCPIDSYWGILLAKKILKFRFIFWVQDFYGFAISNILENKIGKIARIVGRFYNYREKRIAINSDHIVVISEDFKKTLIEEFRVNTPCSVIPNWGNFKDIKYSELQINNDKNPLKIIYTGTMGWKHRPDVTYNLAKAFDEKFVFEIYSQGAGLDGLKDLQKKTPLENLHIYDLVDFKKLSEVLSSADICLCVLEENASKYSVPSKILNYMCAGRPIILIGPANNLSFETIKENKLGLAIPINEKNLISIFKDYFPSNRELLIYSINSRHYAEKNFDIRNISRKFIRTFK